MKLYISPFKSFMSEVVESSGCTGHAQSPLSLDVKPTVVPPTVSDLMQAVASF